MQRSKPTCRIALLAIAVSLISFTSVQAKKSAKPGGGGGSGEGFTLIGLPNELGSTDVSGYAQGLNEVRDDSDELLGVEVVGTLAGQAYYWELSVSGTVLTAMPLPPPSGTDPATTFTAAKDINNAGIVVGSDSTGPALWPTPISVPIQLPMLEPFDRGLAVNVNNNGLVVGWLTSADEEAVVVWGIKPDGAVVGPQLLGAGAEVYAPDVNDAGDVVATIQYQAYHWQVDWDGASLYVAAPQALSADIVDENGATRTVPLQTAIAVNEHGDICGRYTPDGLQIYLLTAEGLLLDMPSLVDNKRFGTRNVRVSDLNDAANVSSIQVAGGGYTYVKRTGAIQSFDLELLWQGDRATDLQSATQQPEAELTLEYLSVVGDAGWLAGYGRNADNDLRAVVLIPD